jgi:hypothetical protein
MSKHVTINESMLKRPLLINGIPQSVYVKECRKDMSTLPLQLRNVTKSKYDSLERRQLSNGFVEEVVEKDYPINSESVTSYVESSDYRNDPAQAIANAPKRVNLGDISQVQNFVRDNPVHAVGQYAGVLRKVADYFDQHANKSAAPGTIQTSKECQ